MALVDFFGASFVVFVLAIAELIAIGWIYGIPRFCKDTEFMLGFRPNLYWRICWRYVVSDLNFPVELYKKSKHFHFVDSRIDDRNSMLQYN